MRAPIKGLSYSPLITEPKKDMHCITMGFLRVIEARLPLSKRPSMAPFVGAELL